jgi:hypothetical protein
MKWLIGLGVLAGTAVLYALLYAIRTSALRWCHRHGYLGPVRFAVAIRQSWVGRLALFWALLVPLLVVAIALSEM